MESKSKLTFNFRHHKKTDGCIPNLLNLLRKLSYKTLHCTTDSMIVFFFDLNAKCAIYFYISDIHMRRLGQCFFTEGMPPQGGVN